MIRDFKCMVPMIWYTLVLDICIHGNPNQNQRKRDRSHTIFKYLDIFHEMIWSIRLFVYRTIPPAKPCSRCHGSRFSSEAAGERFALRTVPNVKRNRESLSDYRISDERENVLRKPSYDNKLSSLLAQHMNSTNRQKSSRAGIMVMLSYMRTSITKKKKVQSTTSSYSLIRGNKPRSELIRNNTDRYFAPIGIHPE